MPACIGCGYCCRQAPCALAQRIYGGVLEKCPELVYRDGRWWCRAVENARGPLKRDYEEGVAIGGGCSSSLFNQDRKRIPTPEEVAKREREARGEVEPLDYHRMFQHVCRMLGDGFMVSGDALSLIAIHLDRTLGRREAEAFICAVRENRSKFDDGFMGEIPPLPERG